MAATVHVTPTVLTFLTYPRVHGFVFFVVMKGGTKLELIQDVAGHALEANRDAKALASIREDMNGHECGTLF